MEDTWKARKNLTLTLGLRYDDSGNPWSKSAITVFGNFYLGTGTTEQEQIANGYAKATHNALLHSVNNLFSPRVGVAWDPTGNGDWAVRGGFGIYNNWLTQANVQEEFRGSPPGEVLPTFSRAERRPRRLPFLFWETADKPPFGFTFPPSGRNGRPQSAAINAQGGVLGTSFAIGGINPLLKSPKSDIWSATLERRLGNNFAASVGYSGSHSYNIVDNGNGTGIVSYGVDINNFPGDLIREPEQGSDPGSTPASVRLPIATILVTATTTACTLISGDTFHVALWMLRTPVLNPRTMPAHIPRI